MPRSPPSPRRWGEVAALRVQAVDLSRRRLEVDQAHTEVGGKIVVGTTKNHERPVPIPRFLAEELREHLADKEPNELVFTSPKGRALRNTNFRPRFFDPAAERVGLVGLTPHELRHTAASLAIKAGANVKVVQQMLSHASAAMTLDVYAGLFADNLDEVADRLDQAFEGIRADSVRTRCGLSARLRALPHSTTVADLLLTRAYDRSRLGESNPGPTHYEIHHAVNERCW
jgi:integrase